MTETTARIRKGSKHFEIKVDLEEANKIKKGLEGADLTKAIITENIFHSLKKGELASQADLEIAFGTTDEREIAEKIIKQGEVVATTESMREEQDQRYKQIVTFLVKNAVSPEGRPYTEEQFMKALTETKINIKNKSVESQITDIIDQLSKILPLKLETKRIRLTIPATHTGKVYSIIKDFLVNEQWQNNGSLQAEIDMPSGMVFDFYENIGNISHGSVISEEIK
jgi:rRNA metabolism SBDS family protein